MLPLRYSFSDPRVTVAAERIPVTVRLDQGHSIEYRSGYAFAWATNAKGRRVVWVHVSGLHDEPAFWIWAECVERRDVGQAVAPVVTMAQAADELLTAVIRLAFQDGRSAQVARIVQETDDRLRVDFTDGSQVELHLGKTRLRERQT